MGDGAELVCPECGGPMKEVYSLANYGRVILLDQCQGCGGVWFDRWELYFSTDEAIKDLESFDPGSFAAAVGARTGKGMCPRCEKALVAFTDRNLPKDALIDRCQGCGGLWLNRGELARYVAHRHSFRGQSNQPLPSEIDTLKNLQKVLCLDKVAKPTLMELSASAEGEPPVNGREVAKDLAFLALQSLMRLVFKF